MRRQMTGIAGNDMKAIRVHAFGSADALQLEEVDDPAPGPGEALVRIHAAGVNPVDTYISAGTYARLPDLPFIPGIDGAGVVESVGHGVAALSVGQRVYVSGSMAGNVGDCYAEKAVCPETALFPLPDAASFAAGAAIGIPYATAYQALFGRGRAKPGETVFIHGASGAVGTACVQLARAHGLTVMGSAGSERGRSLTKEQGAHHALDHTTDGYVESLRDLTGGNGPDLIIEMLANVNLAKDLSVIGPSGRIVIVGNRGTIEINPRDAMARDVDVLGMVLWNCGDSELRAIHAALIAGLENGTLNPVIGREFPLAEAGAAHVAVMEPGAYGKIVLVP